MHKRRTVFAAVLATIGLGLSACGGNGEEPVAQDPPPATSVPSEASSPSATPDGGADGAAPANGDVTAPGTKLKVGARAVLPFEYTSKKKGTIAVTVTAIEKGAPADMAAFGERAKGLTPYFIQMTVENVDGADLSFTSLKLDGVLDGGAGTGVVLIGEIPGKCDRESAPKDFTTKGASYKTCSLSATKGAPVTGAQFDEGDAYRDGPVIWTN